MKINKRAFLLSGLLLTLFNTEAQQILGSNILNNETPVSQYITQERNYFDGLENIGLDYKGLHTYKYFQRTVGYYESMNLGNNVTMQQVSNTFNNWIKIADKSCVNKNQFPYLKFEEVGPYINTVSQASSVLQGTGRVEYLHFVPNSNRIFACSERGGGLFVSDNSGGNWSNAGTDLGIPRTSVSCVATSLSSPLTTWFITTGEGSIYSGPISYTGVGVWRTKNSGQTYERISSTNTILDGSISQKKIICLNGSNGNERLVIASKAGLFMTEDGNATNPIWVKIANGQFYDVEVLPNDQDVIIACGDRNTPLIKYDFDLNTPLNPTVLYDMTFSFNLSNDSYNSTEWRRSSIEFCTEVTDKFILMLTEKSIQNPQSKTKMYMFDLNSNDLVFKGEVPDELDDNIPLPGQPYQAGIGIARGMAWAISPRLDENDEFTLAYGNAYAKPRVSKLKFDASIVLESDWIPIDNTGWTTHTHPDFQNMKFNYNSSELFVSNDGGVFKTLMSDPYNNWSELNTGLGVATAYDCSTSQNGIRTVVGSFHDMGVIVINEQNGNQWLPKSIHYGDGTDDAINKINSNKIFTAVQGAGVKHFENNGNTEVTTSNISGNFQKEFEQHSTEYDKLYIASYSGLKSITHGSQLVTQESNLPINSNISVVNGYSYPQSIHLQKACENPKFSDYVYVVWNGGMSTGNPADYRELAIYRTTTGGSTDPNDWEWVADCETGYSSAVDLTISYDNPDIIWFNKGKELYKVDVSSGVPIKTLYSDGLPNISGASISDICYVNGSDDAIFVASNYGLFYRDNNHFPDQFWEICDFPNVNVKDIEIDYCRKKIVVATYGRGIWESDIDLPQDKPYVIDAGTTVTMSGDYYPGTDVIIEEDATLLITGTLYMPENGKITVKKSGNLRVNGGTITNDCGGFWDGIEVWGDRFETSQSYHEQGHAYFYNDALIENATVAVRNYGINPDGKVNWGSPGGIIQAKDATFKNNRRDVAFQVYQRESSSGVYLNDRSYFATTDFIWDDDFRNEPLNHVTMNKVYGIRFTGCLFSDDRTSPTSAWVTSQNVTNCGIRSIDSKYFVNAKCNQNYYANCVGDLNSGNWTPTTFRNLDFGIYASNSHTENNVIVDRCVFEDNLYGVELVYSNSPIVTRSHFNYTANSNFSTWRYGIHIIRANEIRVEENVFENTSGTSRTLGVVCSDLGEYENELYKNTFKNLSYAVYAQGKNRNMDGDKGLQFLCDENENNSLDHTVKNTLWNQSPVLAYGVRGRNGSLGIPSGNTFTQNGSNFEDYRNDLPNSSNNDVKYYYNSSNTNEQPIEVSDNFFSAQTINTNTCNSNFTDYRIIKLKYSKKAELVDDFNNSENELIQKKENYLNLMNGGNTVLLMEQIENLQPNNKNHLRQTLLSYSPFLSVDVIKAVIDNPNNMYPPMWCYELILENIGVASTPGFIEFLYNKEGNMPNWMIEEIKNHAENGSYSDKDILESEISQLYYDKSFAANMLIRDFKVDTTNNETDSIKYWMERKGDVLTQIRIVDLYLQKRQIEQAVGQLNFIESNINSYPAHLNQEINDFIKLKRHIIGILVNTEGELAGMTQADHKFFIGMSETATGVALYQTREILCFYFDECFEQPINFEEASTRSMIQTNEVEPESELKSNSSTFKVYPNPADDWLAIQLPNNSDGVKITIYSADGKLIMNMDSRKPLFIFETLNLPEGNYVIQINSLKTNELIGSEKIIVTH